MHLCHCWRLQFVTIESFCVMNKNLFREYSSAIRSNAFISHLKSRVITLLEAEGWNGRKNFIFLTDTSTRACLNKFAVKKWDTHTYRSLTPSHRPWSTPLVQSDSESTRRFDLKEIDKLQCWIQNKTLKAQYCSTDWKNLFFRRNIGNIKNLVNDLSDNRLRVFSRSS